MSRLEKIVDLAQPFYGWAFFLLMTPLLVWADPTEESWPEESDPRVYFTQNMTGNPNRAAIGYGWSHFERNRERRGYRWMVTLEGDLYFSVSNAVDSVLWVQAAPHYLNRKQQRIGVYINNNFVGEWTCPHDDQFYSYRMEIPVTALKGGENTLTFRTGYRFAPPGSDYRELSLAVSHVWLQANESL